MGALRETKAQPVPLSRIFCFGGESVGKLLPTCSDCAPGAVQEQYKSGPFSSLSHPLLLPPSPWEQGESEALSPARRRSPPVYLTAYVPLCPMLVLSGLSWGRGGGKKFAVERSWGLAEVSPDLWAWRGSPWAW